jgi:Bacterial lipoate protein ligase C-terminus
VDALDAIFLPEVEPAVLLGLEGELLESAAAGRCPPTLIVHSAPRRTLALGRYHRYSGAPETGAMRAVRRITGGRAAGAGPGWIWLAIVAADLTVLAPEERRALGPEQVINRCVRGLLAALRAIGIDCSYPGRDAITSKRREIAMCSFESDRNGAMLFEAALAIERGMIEFLLDLDGAESAREITCPPYDLNSATTVARELGRAPGFGEIARAIAAGYAELAGGANLRALSEEDLTRAERRGAELDRSGWLRREPAASFNRTGRIASQLGSIQAHLEVRPGGTIARAMLSGEFIANSAGVEEFERALRDRPLEPDAIESAIADTYADGRNFILGLGAPRTSARSLGRMIAQAQ